MLFTGVVGSAFSFFAGASGAEWMRMGDLLLATLCVSGPVLISIGFLSELILFLSRTPAIHLVDATRLQSYRGRR
jgi:hypothetical protein